MAAQERIVVWDGVVRLFHWSTVVAFFANTALTEEGEAWHEWLGYYLLAILAVRLLWGFIGPENARFAGFWPSRRRIAEHLRELKTQGHASPDRHNPLGGLMILSLMGGIACTGISGWMMGLDAFWGEEWLEESHEFFADATLFLVAIHIGVITLLSRRGPYNLVAIMLRGHRPAKPVNR